MNPATTATRLGGYETLPYDKSEMVKAVAAKRGVELQSHGELYRFVAKLSQEFNSPQLHRLFAIASALHQNFYENWLPAETVVEGGEAVKELVELLRKLR